MEHDEQEIIELITGLYNGVIDIENVGRAKYRIHTLPKEAKNDYFVLLLCCCLYIRDKYDGQRKKWIGIDIYNLICENRWEEEPDNSMVYERFTQEYFRIGCWGDMKKIVPNEDMVTVIVKQLLRDHEIANDIDQSGADRKLEISTCAKWCPLPRSKSKHLNLILQIIKKLFPNLRDDTWYYSSTGQSINKSSKIQITAQNKKKISAHIKYRTKFSKYKSFIQDIRKHIDYVEKYMHPGQFDKITPEMLTINNKKKLQNTLMNLPPTYNKTKIKKDQKKKESNKDNYGKEIRKDDDERKNLALRVSETLKTFWQREKLDIADDQINCLEKIISTPASKQFLSDILPYFNHSLTTITMVIEI